MESLGSHDYEILPFNFDEFLLDSDLASGNLHELKDMFKCCICCHFLLEPKMCSMCQTLFCKKCIHKWILDNNGNCPIKCGIFVEKEPNVTAKSILNMIEFNCPSKNEKCGIIKYEKLINHLEECNYLIRSFRCKGCYLILNYDEILEHVKYCIEIFDVCELCNKKIKRMEQEYHIDECIVECKDCKSEICIKNIESHKKEDCSKNVIMNYKNEIAKYKSHIEVLNEKIKCYEKESNKSNRNIEYLTSLLKVNNIKFNIWDNLFDEESIKLKKILQGHTHYVMCVIHLKWKKDNSTIISGGADKTIRVWNIDSNQCINTLVGHNDFVRCLTQVFWDNDDYTIVSGSLDKTIRVWNVEKGVCIRIIVGNQNYVMSIIYLKNITNDSVICSAGLDKSIKLWNVESGTCLNIFNEHTLGVNCISQSIYENENILVSGSMDKTIKIWRFSSCNSIKTLIGHKGFVNNIINLKNNTIASSGSDKTIKIWNLNTSQCVSTLFGHKDSILSLCKFSINNIELIISGCLDGSIRVWHIDSGNFINLIPDHESTVICLIDIDNIIISCSWDKSIKVWKYEC